MDKNKISNGLSKELEGEVIAPLYSIDGKKYSVETLPKMYQDIPGKKRKLFLDTYLNYKLTLDRLVKEQVVYKNEIDSNIKKELDFLNYKGVELDELLDIVLRQKTTLETIALEESAKLKPTLQKEINNFYESHKQDYHYPDNIEISFITSKDENKTQKILNELGSANVSVKRFATFAKKYSSDIRTKIDGGYVGFLTEKEGGKDFFSQLWTYSKKGLVDKVIREGEVFYIIYIHDKKSAGMSQLKDVESDIREHILRKDKNKWIRLRYNDLIEKTKVEIYDSFEENLTL